MVLKIHNTLSGTKEPFAPVDKQHVRVYACGPTVYNSPHIGNFRTFIFYDLLNRVLVQNGYTVKNVINITDIDDKIIDRVNNEDIAFNDLIQKYERIFLEQSDFLSILPSTFNPRASEYVSEMIDFIKSLMDKILSPQQFGIVFPSYRNYSTNS